MMSDNALANLDISWISRGGDAGRRRVEHRGFLFLRFTYTEI